MSNLFVVCLGMGTVFIGLIIMIFICKIMSALCLKMDKKTPAPASAPKAKAAVEETIPNRQETIAAISAAIAEDLQADVSKIRILSVKKI